VIQNETNQSDKIAMKPSISTAYAVSFAALVFALFSNVAQAQMQVQAKTSDCADCNWLKKITREGQDEDVSAVRTKALTSLSAGDLKRATDVLATWIKNPAMSEYDLAVLTARTLVEGHPLWSCDLSQRLKSTWPPLNQEPDISTAKLSQLEVILDSKCAKTFSGPAFMARALKPAAALSVRLGILGGLSAVGYRPTFIELNALLRANQPELRMLAVDWMTRDQDQHQKNILVFIKEAATGKTKQVKIRAYALLASLPESQKAKYWSSEKKPLVYCQRLGDAEVRRACLDSLETP